MRVFRPFLAAALLALAGCSMADQPTPVLSDAELASPDAFVRSVRLGNTTYLYARRSDDPSLFDLRVSGAKRTTEQQMMAALAQVYGCASMRVVGMNRQRTAGLIEGSACRVSQYFRE